MSLGFAKRILLAGTVLANCALAHAGQIPGSSDAADVPVSHHDRIYAAEQFSNTVSVTDPELLAAVAEIGAAEGIFAAPEGAACLPALRKLIADGLVQPEERVVLFNTGAGVKYLECFS